VSAPRMRLADGKDQVRAHLGGLRRSLAGTGGRRLGGTAEIGRSRAGPPRQNGRIVLFCFLLLFFVFSRCSRKALVGAGHRDFRHVRHPTIRQDLAASDRVCGLPAPPSFKYYMPQRRVDQAFASPGDPGAGPLLRPGSCEGRFPRGGRTRLRTRTGPQPRQQSERRRCPPERGRHEHQRRRP